MALLAFTRYLQLAPNSPDAKTIKDWVQEEHRHGLAVAEGLPDAHGVRVVHRLCQTHDLPIAMTQLPPGITFSSQRGHLRDDVGLVVLTGEVDISTAPRFKDDLVALVDEGVTHVVVDLIGVTFIDSTALGVLIGGVRRLHPGGGRLVLVATGRPVLRALTLTGLDKVFTICATREQAVAAL